MSERERERERFHPRDGRIFLDFLSVLRRISRPTATGTLSQTTRVYVKYAGVVCVRAMRPLPLHPPTTTSFSVIPHPFLYGGRLTTHHGDTTPFSALPLAASSRSPRASFCSLPTILPYFSYRIP